jgi:hypothetical protein
MVTHMDVAAVSKPIEVDPEMEALKRFIRDVTWTGTIHEGGMGPGTPAMTGVGRGTVREIQDGRWIAGDFEQEQYLEDETFVLKWELHWVSGWAPEFRSQMSGKAGRLTQREQQRVLHAVTITSRQDARRRAAGSDRSQR